MSTPEPVPSPPSVSEKLTEALFAYGACGPVSVIAWPVGAARSSLIVTVSLAVLPALSVAVIERAPGEEAPELQVLSAPLVLQPPTAERSGYETLVRAVCASELVELSRKLPVAVERKNSVFEPAS